jgi:hypothetical protein
MDNIMNTNSFAILYAYFIKFVNVRSRRFGVANQNHYKLCLNWMHSILGWGMYLLARLFDQYEA